MMLDNKFDYMYRVFGNNNNNNHLSVRLCLIKRLALLYEDLYVKNLLANKRSIVYLVKEVQAVDFLYKRLVIVSNDSIIKENKELYEVLDVVVNSLNSLLCVPSVYLRDVLEFREEYSKILDFLKINYMEL